MFLEAQEFFQKFTSFYNCQDNPDEVNSFFFKYHHSYDVVEYMKKIVSFQNLSQEEIEASFTAVMFHDLGRFVQLDKCGKYDDVTTFDHAKESNDILRKSSWFSKVLIAKNLKEAILYAIFEHNKVNFIVVEGYKGLLARMLRDADKLAILSNPILKNEIFQNLEVVESDKVFECILKQKLVCYENIKSNLDWVIAYLFDFNTLVSYQILKEEELLKPYLEILKNHLQREKYEMVERIYLNKIREVSSSFFN